MSINKTCRTVDLIKSVMSMEKHEFRKKSITYSARTDKIEL